MYYFINKNIETSEVYDIYWKFACERQKIFIKRAHGQNYPWTTDEILLNYKFTNAYRVNDRVSQFLIRDVIYNNEYLEEDIIFRILLFKIFNKIETWQHLEKELKEISYKTYERKHYSSILGSLYESGNRLYSGAYIMPSGKKEFGNMRKYENNLDLLELIMQDGIAIKICKCKSLEELYKLFLSYPTLGSFLSYQYAIDINYSSITNFSEMDFVVAGPGAKSGIRKCFKNMGNYSNEDIIKYVTYNQESEFNKRGLEFIFLSNRKLQLIDCQNLFCETDKYSRVTHPLIKGTTNRTKIKQKYIQNNNKIDYFYPPKWNVFLR